jgi:hypothetical protein
MRIAFYLLLLIVVAPFGNTGELPLIAVTGPTVIAFFPPVKDQALAKKYDMNVTLDDFQFYASKAREPLKKADVDFQEVYSNSFQVQDGKKLVMFQLKKVKIGYYFVSPGMKPIVEYGVMNEADLFECVHKYFGIVVK